VPEQSVALAVGVRQLSGSVLTVVVAVTEQSPLVAVTVNTVVEIKGKVAVF
jgi:dTDP-4-dehydrorhamnose 3,5-epimerase-like enzyme